MIEDEGAGCGNLLAKGSGLIEWSKAESQAVVNEGSDSSELQQGNSDSLEDSGGTPEE
jgi:hypothetical protein